MQGAIRQGDVLLVPRDKPLTGSKIPSKNGKVIVAEGEQTGHHHYLPDSAVAAFLTPEGNLALAVTEPTELFHQEHHAIPVDPSNYDVVIQRRADGAARRADFAQD